MFCTSCGRTIGVEDRICPYCKAENRLAIKHEENIAQFENSFNNTEGEVIKASGKTKGLWIRALILGVMIAAIIILNILTQKNYYGPDTDEILKQEAFEHCEEYTAQLDEFLKDRNYVDFAAFIHAYEIPYTYDEYKQFVSLAYCANRYYDCVRHMEAVVLHSTDKDYHDSRELQIRHFCMYLSDFINTCEVQKEREKDKYYLSCICDMEEDMKALVRTWLNVDEAGAEEFMGLSETQMAVRMEEVFVK